MAGDVNRVVSDTLRFRGLLLSPREQRAATLTFSPVIHGGA